MKKRFDELLRSLEALAVDGASGLTQSDVTKLAPRLAIPKTDLAGNPVYSLSGFADVEATIWNWVRGMHALLYAQFLPSATKHQVVAPMKAFNAGSTQPLIEQLEAQQKLRSHVVRLVLWGYEHGNSNSVIAWGGRLHYHAVWIRRAKRVKTSFDWPHCFWLLASPLVGKMSKGFVDYPYPWVGTYKCAYEPEGAAIFTPNQLAETDGYGADIHDRILTVLPFLFEE